MKKTYLWAFLITLAATLWVLTGVMGGDKGTAENATAPQSAPSAEKSVTNVRVRDSQSTMMSAAVTVTGRTEAARRVDIKAEISAQVTAIVQRKGEKVSAGAIIARLDERDRRIRATEARERVRQREIEFNAASELAQKGFNSKVRLAQSRADFESAKAALARAEIDLGNTTLKAPFDGVIAEQMIEVGNYVDIGTVTFTIVELDPIKISGFVTEKQIGTIRQGDKVTARLLSGQEIEGTLSYVAPAADPATRTFRIEVTVPNPDGILAEGLTATMRIPMTPVLAHSISPSVLTLDDEGRVGVKLVNDENKVEFRPVVIIADEPDKMWIGGLPEQIRLITVGQDFVIPGQIVNPVATTTDGLL